MFFFRPKRILSIALLLSIAVHGVILWWLFHRPIPQAIEHTAIEMEFVEVAAPSPQPDEPKPEKPVTAAPRRIPALPKSAPDVRNLPVEEKVADVPVAAAPPSKPNLSPDSLSEKGAWAIPVEQMPKDEDEATVGGTHLKAPEIPKDIAQSIAHDVIGRGKVERGLVHPYYVELGKTLVKHWDAERAVSAHGLKGFAEKTVENFHAMNQIWAEKAETFGKSGNPFADAPTTERQAAPTTIIPSVGDNFQARKEMQQKISKEFKQRKVALIRVVQNANGVLQSVELVKPSNDPYVDNQALKDIRAVAQSLPSPPKEAINKNGMLSSVWEFELVVSISPPVPTITFEFDEVLGFVDPRLPLDRRIYKHIRLISVD